MRCMVRAESALTKSSWSENGLWSSSGRVVVLLREGVQGVLAADLHVPGDVVGDGDPQLRDGRETGRAGAGARIGEGDVAPVVVPAAGAGGGLGLAIVRGLVEAHGGQVTVRNLDRGCRFEVRLPAP